MHACMILRVFKQNVLCDYMLSGMIVIGVVGSCFLIHVQCVFMYIERSEFVRTMVSYCLEEQYSLRVCINFVFINAVQ